MIAQGFEAGGHRGIFLDDDLATQVGTFALVPQVVDAVKVPVIAAGGIADARGIVAAFALGAAAVQIGTAYLFCPQARPASARTAPPCRSAARQDRAHQSLHRPSGARHRQPSDARGRAPSDLPPAFPLAGGALAPLRAKTEEEGSGDFMPLWSGQAAKLCRDAPSAGELTRRLADEALRRFAKLAG